MQAKVRIGKISYLNLVPFFKELAKNGFKEAEYYSGVPKLLNTKLRRGQLDLSPASNVCLKDPNLELLAPVGVKANGPVKSVYLGLPSNSKTTSSEFYQALEKGKSLQNPPGSIWVSSESEASVELCKKLYVKVFGSEPVLLQTEQPKHQNWQLWIGDEALKRRDVFEDVIDLAHAWRKQSGTEFVFGVWVSRKSWKSPHKQQIKETLLESARLADDQIKRDPEAYWDNSLLSHGVDKNTVLNYWPHIQYELSSSDINALRHFLDSSSLAKPLGPAIQSELRPRTQVSREIKGP